MHSSWGNGRKRPQESTKTRTKLMLEGIGDEYRLLAGSDATCKGRCVPMQKRRIGCTNRRCQKLWKARRKLVWCQNAFVRSSLWPSVNLHRRTFSRPSSSIRPKARFGTLTLCDCRSRRFEGVGKQVVSLRNANLARAAGSRFVHCSCGRFRVKEQSRSRDRDESYLVDPASSHMLVSKIKPCMSKYKLLYCETANGSLNQLSSIWLCPYYMDNRSNSRANTCEKSRLLEGMYLLD